MSIIYEALCTKCDERFNPADEYDLTHIEKEDGTECGGRGVLMGLWTIGDDRG